MLLNCIVKGEGSSFSVTIEPKDEPFFNVALLKRLIRKEKEPEFDNIAADKLVLWKAAFSTSKIKNLNDTSSIEEFFANGECTKLEDATDVIGRVFSDIDLLKPQTVHVIVENSFNSQVKLPPYMIETTLNEILNSVSESYKAHTMDMEEVENSQRQKLGGFFKKRLPHGTNKNQLNLVMLGHVANQEPMTKGKRKFSEIINDDINEESFFKKIVVMIGRSGSGKTATIIHLAHHHFVIYVMCNPHSYAPEFSDQNFRNLAEDVTEIGEEQRRLRSQELGNLKSKNLDTEEYSEEYKRIVMNHDRILKSLLNERIKLEFLARQLFLLLLFSTHGSKLTPEQFFREQTNDGCTIIKSLVDILRSYHSQTITSMLSKVQDRLKDFLQPIDGPKRTLVVALDEAQVVDTVLPEQLISPNAIIDKKNIFGKNGIMKKYLRGFITPLCATLSGMNVTLVLLGTSLSLANATHVHSAIAKEDLRFEKVTCFPWCGENDVYDMLGKVINMTGCQISDENKRMLAGRFRFTISVIAKLIRMEHSDNNMQNELDRAIELAIKESKVKLRSNVRKLLESDQTGDTTHLFSRMVIASKLMKNKVAFSSQREADFVKSALCELEEDDDGYHWVMREPLVIDVVEEELKNGDVDPEFIEYLDSFNSIFTYLGPNSSAKGGIFELLVAKALQIFNGAKIADLPFVKKITNLPLPKWCDDTVLQIDTIGTADKLGYGHGAEGDVEFFKASPYGKLLLPSNLLGPDGVSLFNSTNALALVMKLHTSPIDIKTHQSNTKSSNLQLCLSKTDGEPNKKLKNYRMEYNKAQKIDGVLRIHFIFPCVQGFQDSTPESMVVGNDVLVYIDRNNMDDFFVKEWEGKTNENIRKLKGMINYVISSKVELEKDRASEVRV